MSREPAGRDATTTPRAGVLATLALSALLLPPAAAATAVVRGLVVDTPRDFGYLIGDRITHRVVFELADTHELERSSLPVAARINRWLALDPPRLVTGEASGTRRYELVLDYRLVGAPQAVTEVTTPAMTLDIEGPGDELALAIPAWTFSVGPLLAAETRVEGVAQSLRPARAPPRIDTGTRGWRMGALGAAATLLLVYLAWLHLHLPWLRVGDGPFARAAHDLRGRSRARGTRNDYRQALARVHRAFDETAGRTLLAADVAQFLEQEPRFAPLGDAIVAFYAQSRAVFFVPGGEHGAGHADLRALHRLCLACRDAERGIS